MANTLPPNSTGRIAIDRIHDILGPMDAYGVNNFIIDNMVSMK
jgi:hypothetical protein